MARLKRALVTPLLTVTLISAAVVPVPLAVHAEPAPRRVLGVEAAARMPAGMGVEVAQGYGLPPADIGGSNGPQSGPGDEPSDSAGLVVRVGRLEDQVRQLNGKIEQLQFGNRQLADQLRKLQQDMEFRFQELSGKKMRPLPKRSDATDIGPAPVSGMPPRSRDDAFDPTRDPDAPGAPRVLGAVPAGDGRDRMPDANAPSNGDAPLKLLSSPFRSANPAPAAQPRAAAATVGSAPPVLRPSAAPNTQALTTPGGTIIADREVNPAKEEFDIGLGYLKQKDYENAQKSFQAFLARNPKTRRTSDALYYLGETYFLRGRQREAAEQYLKISANYAHSTHAPQAMLRLGESLHALGAKEQACATFSEVPRKYPNASAAIKASAEREAKRAQC